MTEGLAALWSLLSRESDEEEQSPLEWDRRRYPAPHLEFGVVTAAKIAGILLIPMAFIAGLFSVYLQGFRADVRYDMRSVVTEAIEKHVALERTNYATINDVTAIKEELERLRTKNTEMERDLNDLTRILTRVTERTGIR